MSHLHLHYLFLCLSPPSLSSSSPTQSTHRLGHPTILYSPNTHQVSKKEHPPQASCLPCPRSGRPFIFTLVYTGSAFSSLFRLVELCWMPMALFLHLSAHRSTSRITCIDLDVRQFNIYFSGIAMLSPLLPSCLYFGRVLAILLCPKALSESYFREVGHGGVYVRK
ncbi:MAG: hypothetical protein BYD32DRAFT_42172 [Podila humilis]|nr:MAG: hypothetical protein BYD32DRAFT_42172 [Podila humilis]